MTLATSPITEAVIVAQSIPLCAADLLNGASPFITPVVLVAAAIGAWRVQANILARRTAFDYVAQYELSQDYQDAAAKALRLLIPRPHPGDWEEFAARWSQGNMSPEEERESMPAFQWLNRREFAAIAILNGSMHQPSYATWWGIEFIHEWNRARGFVIALRDTRRGDEDLYSNFERLATSAKFRQVSPTRQMGPTRAERRTTVTSNSVT